MQKNYFELDKVESITFTTEKESVDYFWKEEVPPRPKKFLGFVIGRKPAVPAGWSEYEKEYEEDYRRRKTEEYFAQYSWYRIDQKTKQVFVKPHVEIRFGYKHCIGQRFESDAEAQDWIDELIATSDKQFHVIINK